MVSFFDEALNTAIFSSICSVSLSYYILAGRKKRKALPFDIDERPKVVIISGCDSGFGRVMAESWAENQNLIVVALTLTSESVKKFEAQKNIIAIKCDVTSDQDVQAMKIEVEGLMKENNAVLYSIINNAGIADPGDFVFHKNLDIHKKVMDVNFFGQMRVTQALLPLMMCTSRITGGKIFNMSSVCGVVSSPGNSAYNASKFAVETWSDSLRLELEPFNIQVATIRPGQMKTDIQSIYHQNYMKNYLQAPASIKHLYGGSEFKKHVEKLNKEMMNPTNYGAPSEVADTIYNALLSNNPLQYKYWVGRDACTLWKAFYHLPPNVAHVLKSFFKYTLQGPNLPPVGSVSHVTISVCDLESSLKFYKAMGFEPIGPKENSSQFIQLNPSNNGDYESLVLLQENKNMPKRGECSDAGMTRLCIYSSDWKKQVAQLKSENIIPIAPPANGRVANIAAFRDPDGFVVYIIQFVGVLGHIVNLSTWWKKKKTPCLFHWTINVSDYKATNRVLENFQFKTMSDQDSTQVENDLLPAFNKCPKTTVIEWIRLSVPSKGGIIATTMQWVNPKSVVNDASVSNSMTLSVSDVVGALKKAKELGCHVVDEPSYQKLPIYGDVFTGTAFLEKGNCPIHFCCFSNHKPY